MSKSKQSWRPGQSGQKVNGVTPHPAVMPQPTARQTSQTPASSPVLTEQQRQYASLLEYCASALCNAYANRGNAPIPDILEKVPPEVKSDCIYLTDQVLQAVQRHGQMRAKGNDAEALERAKGSLVCPDCKAAATIHPVNPETRIALVVFGCGAEALLDEEKKSLKRRIDCPSLRVKAEKTEEAPELGEESNKAGA